MSAILVKASVLLVEDSEDLALLLTRWLEVAGHNVTAASDGATGLALCQRADFDILISDIELPFSKGIAVAECSKALYPNRPVILLTALSPRSNASDAGGSVADLFLRKPVRRDVLCGAVEALIEDQRIRKSSAIERAQQDRSVTKAVLKVRKRPTFELSREKTKPTHDRTITPDSRRTP
jgi:DNA-binding response OmpR family regulator